MPNPIIVALDVADPETALKWVAELSPLVGAFKVGKELFVRGGPDVVRRIRGLGGRVFLDLKFHDIPHTVARAVAAAVDLDVQMLTVHASGGRAMLEAAEQSAHETARSSHREPPLVLGVTVLTSLEQADLDALGVQDTVARQVERLARMCLAAGLRGLVCSPMEIAFLRTLVPSSCRLIAPGIRAIGGRADDQKRTLSAREAVVAGADWLVIGRPITTAVNPKDAVTELLRSLDQD
jgi:orotidine-5'-phosphate decarboxylase